jgi:hypothetical protein
MRMHAALGALALCACEQRPDQTTEANRSAPSTEVAAPAKNSERLPIPSNIVENESRGLPGDNGSESEIGALPSVDRPLRFVGRWAATTANCADKAWRFTASSLDTPASSQCRFTNVRKVPGGYDIAARCTAESPPTDDRITLRFAESARAMLFESATIAEVGLVYCGG